MPPSIGDRLVIQQKIFEDATRKSKDLQIGNWILVVGEEEKEFYTFPTLPLAELYISQHYLDGYLLQQYKGQPPAPPLKMIQTGTDELPHPSIHDSEYMQTKQRWRQEVPRWLSKNRLADGYQIVDHILLNEEAEAKRSASETLLVKATIKLDADIIALVDPQRKFIDSPGFNGIFLKISVPNSIDTSLLVEKQVYDEIARKLVVEKNTPHVIPALATFSIDLKHLCRPDSALYNQLSRFEPFQDQTSNRLNVLVTEQVEGYSLRELITSRNLDNPIGKLKKAEDIYEIIAQTAQALTCFGGVGLRHNDLHLENIKVQILDRPHAFHYSLGNQDVLEVLTPYVVRIFDFDRAAIYHSAVNRNNILDDNLAYPFANMHNENTAFDATGFFVSLLMELPKVLRDTLAPWFTSFPQYPVLVEETGAHLSLTPALEAKLQSKGLSPIQPRTLLESFSLRNYPGAWRITTKKVETVNEEWLFRLPLRLPRPLPAFPILTAPNWDQNPDNRTEPFTLSDKEKRQFWTQHMVTLVKKNGDTVIRGWAGAIFAAQFMNSIQIYEQTGTGDLLYTRWKLEVTRLTPSYDWEQTALILYLAIPLSLMPQNNTPTTLITERMWLYYACTLLTCPMYYGLVPRYARILEEGHRQNKGRYPEIRRAIGLIWRAFHCVLPVRVPVLNRGVAFAAFAPLPDDEWVPKPTVNRSFRIGWVGGKVNENRPIAPSLSTPIRRMTVKERTDQAKERERARKALEDNYGPRRHLWRSYVSKWLTLENLQHNVTTHLIRNNLPDDKDNSASTTLLFQATLKLDPYLAGIFQPEIEAGKEKKIKIGERTLPDGRLENVMKDNVFHGYNDVYLKISLPTRLDSSLLVEKQIYEHITQTVHFQQQTPHVVFALVAYTLKLRDFLPPGPEGMILGGHIREVLGPSLTDDSQINILVTEKSNGKKLSEFVSDFLTESKPAWEAYRPIRWIVEDLQKKKKERKEQIELKKKEIEELRASIAGTAEQKFRSDDPSIRHAMTTFYVKPKKTDQEKKEESLMLGKAEESLERLNAMMDSTENSLKSYLPVMKAWLAHASPLIQIVWQILQALAVFRAYGLVHHDLHWNNIFVERIPKITLTYEWEKRKWDEDESEKPVWTRTISMTTECMARIYDFDRAIIYHPLVNRNTLMDTVRSAKSHMNDYNEVYDLMGFIATLLYKGHQENSEQLLAIFGASSDLGQNTSATWLSGIYHKADLPFFEDYIRKKTEAFTRAKKEAEVWKDRDIVRYLDKVAEASKLRFYPQNICSEPEYLASVRESEEFLYFQDAVEGYQTIVLMNAPDGSNGYGFRIIEEKKEDRRTIEPGVYRIPKRVEKKTASPYQQQHPPSFTYPPIGFIPPPSPLKKRRARTDPTSQHEEKSSGGKGITGAFLGFFGLAGNVTDGGGDDDDADDGDDEKETASYFDETLDNNQTPETLLKESALNIDKIELKEETFSDGNKRRQRWARLFQIWKRELERVAPAFDWIATAENLYNKFRAVVFPGSQRMRRDASHSKHCAYACVLMSCPIYYGLTKPFVHALNAGSGDRTAVEFFMKRIWLLFGGNLPIEIPILNFCDTRVVFEKAPEDEWVEKK